MLLLVAIVPLLGVASVTWTAVQEARAISDDASQSEGFAQAAVDLTKLDGAVFDEMVWRAVDSFAASVGVGPEQIEAFIGAEFRPRSEAAFVRTDQILAATGNIEVAEAIAAARATDLDMRAVFDVYRAISESIEASLGSVFDELESAANYGTAGLLQAAAQNLQLAIDTRDAIAQQFHGYFATSFDIGDAPAVELARLIRYRADYLATLAALDAASVDAPALLVGIDRIESDPGLGEFASAVDG